LFSAWCGKRSGGSRAATGNRILALTATFFFRSAPAATLYFRTATRPEELNAEEQGFIPH
jgi:hypothetical protein